MAAGVRLAIVADAGDAVIRPTVLILLLGVAGCGPKTETPATAAPPRPAVVVTTAPVTSRSVQRSIAVVGTLAGFEEVPIAAKVDGRVLAVRADVGDRVMPGAVLLELDPTDLKLEAATAQRDLETELARLGLTALPTGEFKVDAVPSVRRAAAGLASATAEFGRVSKLAGSITAREFDLADLELKTADATHKDGVTQARATLAAARSKQAAVEAAEQKVRDATVLAPVPTGWPAWAALVGPGATTPLRYAVAGRMVSEGEMSRGNPVTVAFKLVLDYALKLRAAVPEQYGAEVRVGQPVEITVDRSTGQSPKFVGVVARINPTVDPATRTFQAEVSIPNLDGRLKAGGFARGGILTRTEAGVLTVPPAALVTFAGVTKVFVIDAGTARAVEVKVGGRTNDYLEVSAPTLAAGQAVATTGFSQLVDGSAVVVR